MSTGGIHLVDGLGRGIDAHCTPDVGVLAGMPGRLGSTVTVT